MTLKAAADCWRQKRDVSVYDERCATAGDSRMESFPGFKLEALKDAALALIEEINKLEKVILFFPCHGIRLNEEVARFEIYLITLALVQTGGNQRRAAQLLGVRETTLNSKVKRYCIPTRQIDLVNCCC